MTTPPTQLLTPPPMAACRGCGCTEEHACPIQLDKYTVVPCWWVSGFDGICSACVMRLHPLQLVQLQYGEAAMLEIRGLLGDFQAGRKHPMLGEIAHSIAAEGGNAVAGRIGAGGSRG